MDYSITQVLHEFLKKRQLIKEIADRMGMKYPTLAGKLNGTYAKLTADELLLLCMAIREAGYGKDPNGPISSGVNRLFSRGPVSMKLRGLCFTARQYTKNAHKKVDACGQEDGTPYPKPVDEKEPRKKGTHRGTHRIDAV